MKPLTYVLVLSFFFITSSAQVTFQKIFRSASINWGYSVQQTTDGGYIVAGWTGESISSFQNVYLIRTNANGDSLWTKVLSGLGIGYSIQPTTDGGYIIVGTTSGGVLLIKTDADGNSIWTKVHGAGGFGRCVQQTTDAGFIIVGYTAGERDFYLIKTDENGDSVWTKTFGGASSDRGYSVQQTTDGGYIFTGETLTTGNYYDIYLGKTDVNGNLLWARTFGGANADVGYSVQQTADNGYIITGNSFEIGGVLIKTDENGDSVWSKVIGDSLFRGLSIKQTSDNGYIIAGTTGVVVNSQNTDCVIIKTDYNGNTQWTRTFGGEGDDFGESIGLTNDGGYIITGATSSFGAEGIDVYLIKTNANGDVSTGIKQSSGNPNIVIYPNPNYGHFSVLVNQIAPSNFTIQIINTYGKIIYAEDSNDSQPLRIDLNNEPRGIFFLKMISKSKIISTKKVITY